MINHVQMVTGRQKVIHIGHSMGTTSFYTMLAKKPQYNEKIFAHLSLAPVAFTSRMRCLEVIRPLTLIMNELVVSTFLIKFNIIHTTQFASTLKNKLTQKVREAFIYQIDKKLS